MSSRPILAAVAALSVVALPLASLAIAAPALAAPALVQTPAPAASAPTEEEVEAAGEAFEADMQKLAEEVDAVHAAAGDDTAKADAEIDALIAKHQPAADTFADTLERFLATMAGMIPPEQMATIPEALDEIRKAPSQIRANRATPAPAPVPATTPAAH